VYAGSCISSSRSIRKSSHKTTTRGGSADPQRKRASAAERNNPIAFREFAIFRPKKTRTSPGTNVVTMLRNVATSEMTGAAELLRRNRCGMTVRITRMKTPHIGGGLGQGRTVGRG